MPQAPHVSLRTFAALPFALALSLTACGDDAKPGDEDATGYIRTSKPTQVLFHLNPQFELKDGAPRRLGLCKWSDPDPNTVDDESTACANVAFDEAALGTGPKSFTIKLGALLPPTGDATITPREGNSSEIKEAYFSTGGCLAPPQRGDTTQELTGTLVFEENTATRLRGRLELRSTGATRGRCPVMDAEADLRFDLQR
ncbi:hypothetical protein MYSTI_04516 [Myxococcus stipitatus DSM 14675]|uniref:Lipoprotein n=1 Tax=Myxococcus stipitatus (strain DSM 14675 / JCM 12634 / Mx s8) TaxID=1278073 RepID=L7UCN5_MYXSD|nr:hypothetical protein [Myxococcus stipitatus]AGC45808.1 hypothetical protein MYSTI_04516 [Myxococcus stipitatus DSM 14675]